MNWRYVEDWTEGEDYYPCDCGYTSYEYSMWTQYWNSVDAQLIEDYDEVRIIYDICAGYDVVPWGFQNTDPHAVAPTDMQLGQFIVDRYWNVACGRGATHAVGDYTGSLTIKKAGQTQETQTVIFQFINLDYARNPGEPLVPSNITYRGQTGFMYNGNVAFIVPITLNEAIPIRTEDFNWPGFQYTDQSGTDQYTYSGRLLWFEGFTNDELTIKLDVGDGAGGPPDGQADDPEDGFENYIPGMRGTNPAISVGESGFTPQRVKIIVRAPKADHIVLRLENISTNRGFTTDTVYPSASRNDVSFASDEDVTTSVMLIAAKTAEGDFIFETFVGDYGANCRISAEIDGDPLSATPLSSRTAYTNLILDTDNDGMADVWEKQKMVEWDVQYGTAYPGGMAALTPSSDIEKNDPDGSGPLGPHSWTNDAGRGDGWSALEEYRGCWFNSASGFGADQGFTRLSPVRKELMVEVDRMGSKTLDDVVTPSEISEAMALVKTAFLETAGVNIHYLMDETAATNIALTSVSLRSTYATEHYAGSGTNTFWRDKFVWLLLNDNGGNGSSGLGISSSNWYGSIVSKRGIDTVFGEYPVPMPYRSNLLSRYSITREAIWGCVIAHELGHAAGCLGDHIAVDPNAGMRIRYSTNLPAGVIGYLGGDEITTGATAMAAIMTEELREFPSGANPESSYWNYAVYETNEVPAENLLNAINAISGDKAEAVFFGNGASCHARQYVRINYQLQHAIEPLPSGTSPIYWSQVFAERSDPGLMSYNQYPEWCSTRSFVSSSSDPTYPRELGSMSLKNRSSRSK